MWRALHPSAKAAGILRPSRPPSDSSEVISSETSLLVQQLRIHLILSRCLGDVGLSPGWGIKSLHAMEQVHHNQRDPAQLRPKAAK